MLLLATGCSHIFGQHILGLPPSPALILEKVPIIGWGVTTSGGLGPQTATSDQVLVVFSTRLLHGALVHLPVAGSAIGT